MKLYIPRLGDKLTLTADWTFLMHNETRNRHFFEILPDCLPDQYYPSIVLSKKLVEKETQMSEFYEKVTGETANGETKEFYRLATDPIEHRRDFTQGERRERTLTFISKELIKEKSTDRWYYTGKAGIEKVYRVKYLANDVLEDYKFTFPAGTTLLVKRIYIRKGSPEFDSVTFSAQNGPHKGKTFWVSLDDVNYIEFE